MAVRAAAASLRRDLFLEEMFYITSACGDIQRKQSSFVPKGNRPKEWSARPDSTKEENSTVKKSGSPRKTLSATTARGHIRADCFKLKKEETKHGLGSPPSRQTPKSRTKTTVQRQ